MLLSLCVYRLYLFSLFNSSWMPNMFCFCLPHNLGNYTVSNNLMFFLPSLWYKVRARPSFLLFFLKIKKWFVHCHRSWFGNFSYLLPSNPQIPDPSYHLRKQSNTIGTKYRRMKPNSNASQPADKREDRSFWFCSTDAHYVVLDSDSNCNPVQSEQRESGDRGPGTGTWSTEAKEKIGRRGGQKK